MPRKKATVMSEGDALEHARRVSQSMTPIGGISLKVKCKNPRQKELLKAIREHDITLVSGPAGTGKSYVSIYAALDWLKSNPETCKKIIFIYPTEEDDGESLGFLPGTSEEKLQPWSAPDMYTIEKILSKFQMVKILQYSPLIQKENMRNYQKKQLQQILIEVI